MLSIKKCPVPADTMLDTYSMPGAYVDCYATEIAGTVLFSEFIFAFYTTLLFKLERWILRLMVAKPSTDTQARQLADGDTGTFAAWTVERRSQDEILMCDFRGRTRSWLMAVAIDSAGAVRTRLYFGSAVIPAPNSKKGKQSIGWFFQALLGFHRTYSALLLYFAKSKLQHRHSRALP